MENNLSDLRYRQLSLRETVIDALQFIGIKDYADFDLQQDYFNNPHRGHHDARHLYRTMLATALIARKINEPRKGLLAFCGAYIHDLAQRRDGEGEGHGPRAAHEKWDKFSSLWQKYELTPEECSQVRDAVCRHSGGDSDFQGDTVVQQILHDADSLDRCRFRQNGRLNWDFLALPQLKVKNDSPSDILKALIGETEAICGFTKFMPSFMPFKDFVCNIR